MIKFSDSKTIGKSDAFGFLSNFEAAALMTVAHGIREKNPVFVNIGAGAGTSGLALREGCQRAKIYTVDISPGGPLGGMENEVNAFADTDLELPTQILGDSKEVGAIWKWGEIDLLFIDGDHSYEGCRGDLAAWLPHLKPGGWLLVHDYDGKFWPDVTRVMDELENQGSFGMVSRSIVVDTLWIAQVLEHWGPEEK